MSLFGMHADRGREPQGPIVSFVLTVRIEAPRHPAVNPEGLGPSFETCNRRLSVVASGNPHFVLARDQEPGWVAREYQNQRKRPCATRAVHVPDGVVDQVLVVNDGSDDNTANEAEKAADNFCSKIIFSSELSSYFCKACNAYHNGHRRKFYNFDYHAGKFINDLDEEYDNTFGRA